MNNENRVDILVKAIDNFGDFGFALDFSESLLESKKAEQIRFFGDNEALFQKLTKGIVPVGLEYFNLEDYTKSEPSKKVILCFDMKVDMDFFMEQAFPIDIKILSYLRFDDGVGSMNGTSYGIDNLKITHLVPSPRKEGAGIVIRRNLEDIKKTYSNLNKAEKLEHFFKNSSLASLSKIDVIIDVMKNAEVTSVFCYPAGQKIIQDALQIGNGTNKRSFIFFSDITDGEIQQFAGGTAITLPYLRFDEYEILLSLCDKNIVRGENSAMKALQAGKPFLWDIYKESNSAHFGKLEEFFSLFPKENEWVKNLFISWNTEPTIALFEEFLEHGDALQFPEEIEDISDII